MWKRPPTKRGRVEFADEGRGREASSLSVFVLGYAWPECATAKYAAKSERAQAHASLCRAAAYASGFLERQPHKKTVNAGLRRTARTDRKDIPCDL